MSNSNETAKLAMLEKKRKEMLDSFAAQKNDITAESAKNRTGSDRFVGKTDGVEESLKRSTYGLVNLADFKETREKIEEQARQKAVQGEADKAAAKPKKIKKKKDNRVKLSFAMDDDDEVGGDGDGDRSDFAKSKPSSKAGTPGNGSDNDDERAAKRAKLGKDPTVATSFLPDREREEAERAIREELRKEWLAKQEDMKDEDVEITCSYWDGSGHRTSITCKKGDTVAQFLNKCRAQFAQLRTVSVDNLMYIKEDLIIPHHYTFYDFIVNKYRGKSGPMFNFDVHDDVRMVADATVEKDESHAGKIVERSWYNRSKHIFPASRWEVFSPDVVRDKYTIHGN